MLKYECIQASRDEWIAVARSCPYATYFHTPYWYELAEPERKPGVLSVRFDDGVSAIVPFAEIRRVGGLFIDHFSSPKGNYGGWVSGSALSGEHINVLLNILMSKRNITFRVNPFDPSSRFIGSINNIDGVSLKSDFTHTLDLRKGIDRLRGGMSRGHRSSANSAVRNGVTVRQAETVREWECYYELYLDTLNRWRAGRQRTRTVYSAVFFRRIYECRSGNEILWLAFKDGEPIAGALCFYWGRHAVYWHGVASASSLGFRPNNLLFWEIISDAARRGCEIFDFNPSGGYGGVESFKERFGAERVPTYMITTRSPLRRAITRLRGCLARGIVGKRRLSE
ncbi:hypothetical protein R80B4_01170 [Fibrobacteres bacterium R8-0-B4]